MLDLAGASPELRELVDLFIQNRRRHGKVWRKVPLASVYKLLPHLTDEHIFVIIREGIERNVLETCEIAEAKGFRRPALKLTYFPWKSSLHL